MDQKILFINDINQANVSSFINVLDIDAYSYNNSGNLPYASRDVTSYSPGEYSALIYVDGGE